MLHERSVRFVGGGTVPSRRLGRVTGTWPTALLEVGPLVVSLRLRGIARAFGPERLEAMPATLRCVSPVRGLTTRGVGFTDLEGREFCFWTYRSERILERLTQLGYPVVSPR